MKFKVRKYTINGKEIKSLYILIGERTIIQTDLSLKNIWWIPRYKRETRGIVFGWILSGVTIANKGYYFDIKTLRERASDSI